MLPVAGGYEREGIFAPSHGNREDHTCESRHRVSNPQNHQVLEVIMRVKYDQEVDVLTIRFNDTPVEFPRS